MSQTYTERLKATAESMGLHHDPATSDLSERLFDFVVAMNRIHASAVQPIVFPTIPAAARRLLDILRDEYQVFGERFCWECEAEPRADGSWYHADTCAIQQLKRALEREGW